MVSDVHPDKRSPAASSLQSGCHIDRNANVAAKRFYLAREGSSLMPDPLSPPLKFALPALEWVTHMLWSAPPSSGGASVSRVFARNPLGNMGLKTDRNNGRWGLPWPRSICIVAIDFPMPQKTLSLEARLVRTHSAEASRKFRPTTCWSTHSKPGRTLKLKVKKLGAHAESTKNTGELDPTSHKAHERIIDARVRFIPGGVGLRRPLSAR